MGLKNLPYWVGTFCFDYCMFFSTVIFFVILLLIFNIKVYVDIIG